MYKKKKKYALRRSQQNHQNLLPHNPPPPKFHNPPNEQKKKLPCPVAPHLFNVYPLPSHVIVGLNQQRPLVTSRFLEYYKSSNCDSGYFPYLKNHRIYKGFWDSILCLNLPNGNGYLDDVVCLFPKRCISINVQVVCYLFVYLCHFL